MYVTRKLSILCMGVLFFPFLSHAQPLESDSLQNKISAGIMNLAVQYAETCDRLADSQVKPSKRKRGLIEEFSALFSEPEIKNCLFDLTDGDKGESLTPKTFAEKLISKSHDFSFEFTFPITPTLTEIEFQDSAYTKGTSSVLIIFHYKKPSTGEYTFSPQKWLLAFDCSEDREGSFKIENIQKADNGLLLNAGKAQLAVGNNEKAFFCMGTAAYEGNPEALFLTGMMCVQGLGTEPDTQKGLQMLNDSAEKGHIEAQYTIGLIALEARDYKKAYLWLRKAADQNLGEAQYKLGTMYQDGLGLEKDSKEAEKWFLKAEENGFKPEK